MPQRLNTYKKTRTHCQKHDCAILILIFYCPFELVLLSKLLDLPQFFTTNCDLPFLYDIFLKLGSQICSMDNVRQHSETYIIIHFFYYLLNDTFV